MGLIDLTGPSFVNYVSIPLADNLTTSGKDNEVFVSSGQVDSFSRKRFGVDVLALNQEGRLELDKTFFLGINGAVSTYGRPKNDQIRDIVFKPASTLTLELADATVRENAGAAATKGTVRRANADLSQPLTVTLSSSDTSEALVPTTVTIPQGEISWDFNITAVDDTLFDGMQSVTIGAAASGFVAASGTLNVTDHETLALTMTQASISERAGNAAATVTRSNTDLEEALVITLNSSSPTGIALPFTVEICATRELRNIHGHRNQQSLVAEARGRDHHGVGRRLCRGYVSAHRHACKRSANTDWGKCGRPDCARGLRLDVARLGKHDLRSGRRSGREQSGVELQGVGCARRL